MRTLCLAFALLLVQDDDLPVPADAPAAYRKAMEAGKDALQRKKFADAAREFGAALRAKPGDKTAEKGFGRAIRELEIYNTRFGDLKTETVKKFGMEKALPAIEKGLKWLAAQQKEDGRWSCKPTHATDDMASTAFALLAFLADGNSETTGPFKEVVAKGAAWLVKQQQADGSFGGVRLYTEGLCTLALVEAFVMGGTEAHYEAAQKGINHVVKSQRPKGGWMYKGDDDGAGDSSVTGMMFQPLKQGQMAFLDFDETCLERGRAFIDAITDKEHWVGYREGDGRRHIALTAIGNLVRVYAGAEFADEKVKGGLALVLKHKDQMKVNLYFLYYGVMLCFLAGGDAWTEWRDVMLPRLLDKQTKEGSWIPEGEDAPAGFANYLSTSDATAMALLSLECCYRYVPKKMLK
jgi:hypothetical protein